MAKGDLATVAIFPGLPPADHYLDRAVELFARMRDARIVAIGAVDSDEIEIEGGGLVIDYVPIGNSKPRRVVFGFNDLGMWVEHEGPA